MAVKGEYEAVENLSKRRAMTKRVMCIEPTSKRLVARDRRGKEDADVLPRGSIVFTPLLPTLLIHSTSS